MPSIAKKKNPPVRISLKRNDQVKVIAGRDAGKTGRVLDIDEKSGRVTVEHVNMIKRHTRKNPQKRMEGGPTDRMGKPLFTLDDYLEGKAPFVSLACDSAGGPPGNVAEFRKYGFRVSLPEVSATANKYTDARVQLPISIEFRLVDTGDDFTGKTKLIREAGREPIDVCRRSKPAAEKSVGGMMTELWLIGPP